MPWDIPAIPNLFPKPRKTKRNSISVWLFGLAAVYLIWLPVIWLFWYQLKFGTAVLLLSALFPLAVWFLGFSTIVAIGTNRTVAYQAWEAEKQNIHQQWVQWAGKKIAVVEADYALSDNSPQKYAHSLDFFERKFEALLKQSRHKKVTVYVAVEDSTQAWTEFQEQWPLFGKLTEPYKDSVEIYLTNIGHNDLDFVSMWTEEPEEGLSVVVSMIANEKSSGMFAEQTAWLVFSPPNIQHKQAEISRTIKLDLLSVPESELALGQFKQYTLKGQPADSISLIGFSEEMTALLKSRLIEVGWFSGNHSLKLHPITFDSENIHPLNHWLMLASALQEVQPDGHQLIAWKQDNDSEIRLVSVHK